MAEKLDPASAIAVVGMSARVPGAISINQFWENLRQRRESISFFSVEELVTSGIPERVFQSANYVRARGIIEGIEMFDADFFGFTPREAQITDPQHRILLECAWEAIEDAGYNPENASNIGVYAGVPLSTYLFKNLLSNPELMESLGSMQLIVSNVPDHVSTKISYKLNLRGPSVGIGTACSTSLVAVHLACRSLMFYECDMALAGGACLMVPQKAGYQFEEGSIMSSDGSCRAFDASATGTVGGSGAGMVLMKRLTDAIEDHDSIRGVILGSAINNDGSNKVGYTAPSPEGQCRAIQEALALANVDPSTIDYVEAHGTGTPLGDPIEISALMQAFQSGTKRRRPCAIGAVKTNIGHLDAAAGVAGLIKTLLCLQHRKLAPTVHFESLNPKIKLNPEMFFINEKLREWTREDGHPRRAGVSSFGIGGTNAHLILQEADPVEAQPTTRPSHLLVLSAKTETALEKMALNLAAHLEASPQLSLADVAHTLAAGRKKFMYRRAMVCSDLNDAAQVLRGTFPKRVVSGVKDERPMSIVFLFPGQGSQYPGMGRGLFETEPVFRETIDHCAHLLEPALGLDLRKALYPSTGDGETAATALQQTRITQPALFATEYALGRLWMEWGVRPDAMIGHSLGEIVAACLAGVFSLEDALRLVTARAELMQSMAPGAMLMVRLAEPELTPLLGDNLSLAAVNGPQMCVVSGPTADVKALEQTLEKQNIVCSRLRTSHAFHSAMMDPILDQFVDRIARIAFKKPLLRYFSNLTGAWISDSEATNPEYWAKQLRHTVRFWDSLQMAITEPGAALIEVGPGRTLATAVRESSPKTVVLGSLRHPNETETDTAFLLKSAGRLWVISHSDRPRPVYSGEIRSRAPLPTYPFERRRYWVDAVTHVGAPDAQTSGEAALPTPSAMESTATPTQEVGSWSEIELSIARIWETTLGIGDIAPEDNFFDLGGDSLQAVQILATCRRDFNVTLPARTFFQNPTVIGLAESIALEQLAGLSEVELEQALMEVKNLSADQLQADLLSE